MATVRHWTGRESRALRQAMRLTVRAFADKLGVAARTVTSWEQLGAEARPRPDSQAMLDTALQHADDGARARFAGLIAAGRHGAATGLPQRGRSPARAAPTVDSMDRRHFLGGFAALSVAGPAAATDLESVRHGLLTAFGGEAGDLTDWDEIAAEYGQAYFTRPPAVLVADLADDLTVAQRWLDRPHDAVTRRGMGRVVAQLAVYQAHTLGNLGDFRSGQRWWRIGREAAEGSGDRALLAWVLGTRLVRGLYEDRPLETAVAGADEVVALSGAPTAGLAGALAGQAQAYALHDRVAAAEEALLRLAELVGRLPADVLADTGSMLGWPEYRLRHTESFVYTHLRRVKAARTAQDRALELYPPELVRERTQLVLHRAACAIHSGDIGGGAGMATEALTALPQHHHTGVVMAVARSVLDAVPRRETRRAEVSELRELLSVA